MFKLVVLSERILPVSNFHEVGMQPSPDQSTAHLDPQAVAQLLNRLSGGDRNAIDHLVPLVYDQSSTAGLS